jgi:hypothetical protein
MRVDNQRQAPAALARERNPVPIVQTEAGWTPEPVWPGAENVAYQI